MDGLFGQPRHHALMNDRVDAKGDIDTVLDQIHTTLSLCREQTPAIGGIGHARGGYKNTLSPHGYRECVATLMKAESPFVPADDRELGHRPMVRWPRMSQERQGIPYCDETFV